MTSWRATRRDFLAQLRQDMAEFLSDFAARSERPFGAHLVHVPS